MVTMVKFYFSTLYYCIFANVRVYDHLRHQSDSVARYTKATQRDTVCDLMPSN